METPTPVQNVAAMLAEYWGYLLSFLGGLTAMFVFYHKYCKGKYTALKAWGAAFVAAPNAIKEMRDELSLDGGLTFRQWAALIDDDLKGVRRIVAFETISRRYMWDSIDAPIFEAAIDGKFLWANRAYLKTTECEMKAILGHNWRNVVAGPDRDELIDGWEMAVRDGTDYKAKFRLATDNSEKWVRFSVICNKDDLGNVLGFTGKLWEIPDPRQAGGGIHETLP